MSGFETLDSALVPQVGLPMLPEAVAWTDEQLADQVALDMVVSDVQTAQAFPLYKGMQLDWEIADNLYRGIVTQKVWDGGGDRANLSMPVVMEAVEKLMPPIHLAFFSDKQPFLILPKGKTTPAAARAQANLLNWAVKKSGFKEEIRKTIKNALLYGFCFAKWGWKSSQETTKKYVHDKATKKVTKEENCTEISHPTLESMELRNVLVDPSTRSQDCRKGRFVVYQIFTDANTLDSLRDDDTYKNIPSREELAEILGNMGEATTDSMGATKSVTWLDNQAAKQTDKQSVDPLKQPLEILEYVQDDKVITVLQRKIVIRNEENEFHKKNLLSCAFIDVPGAMYGFGVAKLLGGEQMFQTSVGNMAIDQMSLSINPPFTEEKGLGSGAQQIKLSPGKVLTGNKLTVVEIPNTAPQAFEAISISEARAARRVGANGGDSVPTQALRTAEGVNSFNQGVVDKLQYFIEIFSEMVFIPVLEAFLDVCRDNLQPADIQKILSDADGKAYEGDVLEVYNADCEIQVLSSTKLAARRAAANLVPLLLQFVQAPAVSAALTAQNKKFDFAEFLSEVVDLSGWDVNSLIVDASPQEVQQSMMMLPGAQKAQMDAQVAATAQKNALEQIDAQGIMKAGVKVIDYTLKKGDDLQANSEAGLPREV